MGDMEKMQFMSWTITSFLVLAVALLWIRIIRSSHKYVKAEQDAKQQLENINAELHSTKAQLKAVISASLEQADQAKFAESRLAAVLTSMGEGLCQLDAAGNLVYMNPAAQHILHQELDAVIGRNMHDLIHAKTSDDTESTNEDCPLLQVVKSGVLCENNDDVFWRSDGSAVAVQYISSPLRLDGETNGAVVSFQDITERKAAEKRLREFYATLSHELRTPLATILASLGLIDSGRLGELPPKAGKLITISRTECDRIIRLINDILDLSKIEAGMLELHLSETSVGTLVERAAAVNMAISQQRNISIKISLSPTPVVNGDEDRILQIINNLLSNAIKFSPDGGIVEVDVREAQGKVRVSISDQGSGIPVDQIYKLFKRLQRLQNTSNDERKPGTGLGLAICKALVEQHNGVIGVESEVGKGTTFWFALPPGDSDVNG